MLLPCSPHRENLTTDRLFRARKTEKLLFLRTYTHPYNGNKHILAFYNSPSYFHTYVVIINGASFKTRVRCCFFFDLVRLGVLRLRIFVPVDSETDPLQGFWIPNIYLKNFVGFFCTKKFFHQTHTRSQIPKNHQKKVAGADNVFNVGGRYTRNKKKYQIIHFLTLHCYTLCFFNLSLFLYQISIEGLSIRQAGITDNSFEKTKKTKFFSQKF